MSSPFQKIEEIFHDALDLPAAERDSFVEHACTGDPDLLREVQSLLLRHSERTLHFEAAVQSAAFDLLGAASIDSQLAPGAMLGPYRLDSKLGEGGMGAVYLGVDTRLGRSVALKVIGRAIARSAGAQARFLREARSAAALSHPNIAAIYDVVETAESPWLVMEYVNGVTLRSLLNRPLGERAWLHYASQIAAALSHAHARGIIHRDLKPENILITADDQVKIIDFGLARTVHDQAAGSGTITAPNAFVGTIAYAAPELIAGGAASARSDVYSLGVLLYEMACGEHPFAGLKGYSLVSAISAGSYIACKQRTAGIAAGISSVVDRSMMREPAARYNDGVEIAAALQDLDAQPDGRPADTPPALAVIDFENIGGSPEFEWLSTGIAETLSTDLARVRSVRTVSRNHVVQKLRRFGNSRNSAAAAVEIGCELGARWIVTGGYQKIGNRVRVTVALIDTTTGQALAAEKIDGKWSDLFDVQDRVVEAVLKSLALSIASEQMILPAETRDIAAYEHYIRARQEMYPMEGKSLQAAITHFGQAIRLDPDYALAYSGLGTSHALQFIRTSNPEDIQRASGYLERAIELDPELGEPYPWLANIRLRKNDPAGCLAAGRKGIELQPDLCEAHYFYGAVFYMAPEIQSDGLRVGAPHLGEAIRLEPRFYPAWLLLSASVLFLGMHGEAIRILNETVRMLGRPDLLYPFPGARTLLGFALARQGSWAASREQHLRALEDLRNNHHVYTTTFTTLSSCGLGEIELRNGNERDALTYFRRARLTIGESRRAVGSVRLLIRINAGLACAYAATGDTARARELAGEAAAQIESLTGQTATATFESSLAQLWLSLTCAEIRLANLEAAADCLDRSRKAGWLDTAWLRTDPELRALRDHPVFLRFVQEVGAAPALSLPLLVYGSGSGPEAASGTA